MNECDVLSVFPDGVLCSLYQRTSRLSFRSLTKLDQHVFFGGGLVMESGDLLHFCQSSPVKLLILL